MLVWPLALDGNAEGLVKVDSLFLTDLRYALLLGS